MESGVSGEMLDVIEVNAKSGVRKFSIRGEDSIEFVTLYTVEKTTRQIVQYHLPFCNMNICAKREVTKLDGSSICTHLVKFQEYCEENPQLFASDQNYVLGDTEFLPAEEVTTY